MHRNLGYTVLIPKSWLAQSSLSDNVRLWPWPVSARTLIWKTLQGIITIPALYLCLHQNVGEFSGKTGVLLAANITM